jgi:hypothetical protein
MTGGLLLVTACLGITMSAAPWLLVAPPYVYEDGAVRLDDDAPLPLWQRLGEFDDGAACREYRDAAVRKAADDEQWAFWSKTRCVCGPSRAARCGPDLDDDTSTP